MNVQVCMQIHQFVISKKYVPSPEVFHLFSGFFSPYMGDKGYFLEKICLLRIIFLNNKGNILIEVLKVQFRHLAHL